MVSLAWIQLLAANILIGLPCQLLYIRIAHRNVWNLTSLDLPLAHTPTNIPLSFWSRRCPQSNSITSLLHTSITSNYIPCNIRSNLVNYTWTACMHTAWVQFLLSSIKHMRMKGVNRLKPHIRLSLVTYVCIILINAVPWKASTHLGNRASV